MLRVFALTLGTLLVASGVADAHPLGNFTTNHLSRLTLQEAVVHVEYIVDLAEIPAFGELRRLDREARPAASVLQRWAGETAAADVPQLRLTADGVPLALSVTSAEASTAPGAAGLRTLRLDVRAIATAPVNARVLRYADGSYAGRIGWRDVVANAQAEPTGGLRVYPPQLLGSPRSTTTLDADIANGALHPRTASEPDPAGSGASLARGDAFADLLNRDTSSPLLVLGALLIAIALGALHAMEPGHGKTLLAVSLVGARATAGQALILATSLTFAHTAGVLVLGAVVLLAARSIVPEQIYPWVTLVSGTVVVVVASRSLAAHVRRARGFDHVHTHAHDDAQPHVHAHSHAADDDHHRAQAAFAEHARAHAMGVAHDHGGLDDLEHARLHAIPGTAPLTFRSALVAAVTGNIAPCPAALVVLLAAIASHRIVFGLALIVAFSLGLAGVLTGLGIAVVRGAAWLSQRPAFDGFARRAPLVSAGVISIVGSVLVGQGLAAQGIAWPVPALAALVLAAIVGYAFSPFHPHGAPAEQTA